jgi:hypothetical protein
MSILMLCKEILYRCPVSLQERRPPGSGTIGQQVASQLSSIFADGSSILLAIDGGCLGLVTGLCMAVDNWGIRT